MKGVQYLIDASGAKTAVVIDLKKHGELWEEFCDQMIAQKRQGEHREYFEEVRKRLRKTGKLRGNG